MQYKLVDDQPLLSFSFKDIAPDKDGTYSKSNGGTERMYRHLVANLDPTLLKKFQIICSRVRSDNLDSTREKILWLHDTWDDPESQHLKSAESRSRFKQFIFVSNYQFNTYNIGLGVPYQNSLILKNAIIPIEKHVKPDPKKCLNLIYHTTPHRGLELLIPAYNALLEKHPNMHLDVYSSFSIYGWPDRDKQYKELLDHCKSHPKITYHGAVPNEQIREALKKAHIFAFPSIWPETSCIAAMEAMSAGVAVVTSDFGALPETLGEYGLMYRFSENLHQNVNRFATLLNGVIENWESGTVQDKILAGKNYANALYSWDHRLKEWETLLRNLD